ncbi:MAG TPA: hypothetical protein VK106_00940 [Balneolaceae bacterium]|nr:hypothetical protein [Balneolaceae bacterium]
MSIKSKVQTLFRGKSKKVNVEDITKIELAVLSFILEEQTIPNKEVSINIIIEAMKAFGFRKLETNIAFRSLKANKMIDLYFSYDEQTNKKFSACSITEEGEKWIIKNKKLLHNLKLQSNSSKNGETKSENGSTPKRIHNIKQA